MRRGFVLVALVLLVAACAGGGKKPQGTPATTTGAAATTTTAVSVAADQAKARTLLLRSSDFPAGWRATPAKEDPSEKAFNDEVAACVGLPSPDTYTTARVDSSDFSKGNAGVSSRAALVRTVEDFQADVAAASGPKYAPCLKRGLGRLLVEQNPGASLQSVTVEPVRVPRYGAFSMGFRVAVKLLVQGQAVRGYLDLVLLGKGRTELTVTLSNPDQPFDPSLGRSLVAKLGARLAAA